MDQGSMMHSLFEDTEALEKEHRITSALDAINSAFGDGAIKLAVQGSGRIHSGTFKCVK